MCDEIARIKQELIRRGWKCCCHCGSSELIEWPHIAEGSRWWACAGCHVARWEEKQVMGVLVGLREG